MISYKKLIWDSDFFQKEIYKVNLNQDVVLTKNELLKIKEKKDKFFYLFSNVEQTLLSDFLVDDKVTFKKDIVPATSTPITIYDSELDEFSQLLALAYAAGKYSRFRSDTVLGIKFEEMYALWLKKSINGALADFVLVERNNSSLLGFVTLKQEEENFSIGLIAVSPESRGLGVGSKLLEQCENLALENNVSSIVVPTQRKNKQACSFYEKNGYKELYHEFIYHINTYADSL